MARGLGRTTRFIHAADLHLGSPLRALEATSEEIHKKLNDATYKALERIVDHALSYQVDFVLFAGDIYDRESRSVRANQFIEEQFSRLSENGTPVFLVYGNHDPLGEGHEYISLPEKVEVFPSNDVISHVVRHDGEPIARVLGQSYRSRHESRKMYQRFSPEDESVPNIGLLHTDLNPQSNRYVPCSVQDLQGKDEIDYWALGHRHSFELPTGQSRIAYPGMPQGRNPSENGIGGCLLVELDLEDESNLQFLPTSELLWTQKTINLSEIEPPPQNLDDLLAIVNNQAESLIDQTSEDFTTTIEEMGVSCEIPEDFITGHLVRWTITGRAPVHSQIEDADAPNLFLEEKLRDRFREGDPFLWTESVQLRTGTPIPDLEDLISQDDVFKEVRHMIEELKQDEEFLSELREEFGQVWKQTDDHEADLKWRLPLTSEREQEIIEDAQTLIYDQLAQERFDNVD